MPTNNGPMPPACPYVGGNINLDSSKEKLVTTISSQSRQEITMPTNPMPPACPYVGGNINLDSSKEKLVTTISSQSRQEITMPTNNGPMPPACPYVGGNINLDSSKEKTDFDNFFSDNPIIYWILFSLASASLIFTVNYLFAIVEISYNHLEESRKLPSNFSEYSDDGLAKITNLRTAAQSATFHLVISLSIFILCFFNPIRTIFKNNTKKTLATIFILAIEISAIVPIILYYFKYIGNIPTLSFFIAITTITIIVIAIIFIIIKIISIVSHKVVSIRKGKTYTGREQFLHYAIFIFVPTLAIFLIAFLVLLADTLSTALYDQHTYRTTPAFLEEFFNDPDIKIVLFIFFLFSFILNTSTAISIIGIIKEIFKNKRSKKAKRIILLSEGKSTRSTIASHIKLILPLLPLAVSIVFTLALIHNTQVADNNLSTAIQITAIQFTDSKYSWVTTASSLLLIGYISSIPYFLLPRCVNGAEKIVLRSRSENTKKEVEYIYSIIICVSSFLTFFCTFINYQILKFLSHKDVIIFLLTTIFISFALCSISLRSIMDKKYAPKSTMGILPKTRKENMATLTLAMLSVFLISLIGSALIPNITKGFSDMVTSPGDTLGSIETDYSCVFSNNVEEKNSIAFGVIVESKPDSVHIFTPEYNQEKNSYGEEVGNGKVKPNKLAESQVKIPGGYRIEKFDNNKHGYDLTVGKCIYRNSPPFYMYTYSWNTSDRN